MGNSIGEILSVPHKDLYLRHRGSIWVSHHFACVWWNNIPVLLVQTTAVRVPGMVLPASATLGSISLSSRGIVGVPGSLCFLLVSGFGCHGVFFRFFLSCFSPIFFLNAYSRSNQRRRNNPTERLGYTSKYFVYFSYIYVSSTTTNGSIYWYSSSILR